MVGNDEECLDHEMRANYYELSLANAITVRNNSKNPSYIFCARDPISTSTSNYYLTSEQQKIVQANARWYDVTNRVIFVQTCARLDSDANVTTCKALIEANPKWQKTCEVLNHEWAFDNTRMADFLNWAKNTMGFQFGFFSDIFSL
jgi:hypothetical protein